MGLSGSALVLLLHAAVDSTFHEPAMVILLVILGGLVHNLYMQARPDTVIWRRIGFSYHPAARRVCDCGALVVAVLCAQSDPGLVCCTRKESVTPSSPIWKARWPGTSVPRTSIQARPGITIRSRRTAIQLHRESGASDWLIRAAEEEAIARRLNPVDGRFAFRAGTVYRLMASQTLTSAQRAELLAKASDAYRETIRLDPYSPFGYFELAQLRLNEGRVKEAIELLTTATAHEPNFLPGRALLAELSLKLGIPGDYAREMSEHHGHPVPIRRSNKRRRRTAVHRR